MDFPSEEPDDMSHTFLVQWTIKPRIAPRPWLACNRCRTVRPFEPSGKTRLNANGRRLDAWLIYRCSDCDSTWNRPIFERRHIRDIDPATLHALQNNDGAWIEKVSFDLDGLRQNAGRIEEFAEVHVEKTILNPAAESSLRVEIVLGLAMKTSLRAERLLSMELGLSRRRIAMLEEEGRITTTPLGKNTLRRSVKDQMRITIDLAGEADRNAILSRAGP
ncbi:DUF1062 domain-containing protein [Ensifer adhaerens]|nr:DUF1062 domain-containing protein [Ensifer adhaerens]